MSETAAAARTVALTGATGFVGARILQELTACGHTVRALTRRPQAPAKGVQWVSGDLAHAEALLALVSGADAVIHCAGLVKARRAEEFDAVNHQGCRQVCLALSSVTSTAADTAPPHFMLISSLAARQPEVSAYAASKAAGERTAMETLGDIPWTILRPPGVYGPGDTEILKLLRVMRRGFALAPGSADSRFSLIHVDDLAAAVAAALWQPAVYSKAIEPDDGKGGGYAMDDVRAIVASILDRRIRTLTVPAGLLHLVGAVNEIAARLIGGAPMLTRGKARELTHADWVSAGNKLQTMIDWQPRIDLQTGLADAIAWYRKENLL
jgi:nucleoside-diphosphate-sugar epimerase